MIRGIALLLGVVGLAGCRTGPLGPYISPRMVGRVEAADSGLALEGVRVSRGQARRASTADQTKGAEWMVSKIPARTDREGRFTLGSERVLSVFRGSSWNQARLTFEAPGYETFHTNYPTATATNSPAGEPVVDIGTVRLAPSRR